MQLEKWWACTALTSNLHSSPRVWYCLLLLHSAHQDHARERHFLFAASIGENFLPLRGHKGVHSHREVATMLLAHGRARAVGVLFAGLECTSSLACFCVVELKRAIASALLAVDGDGTVMAHGHRVQPQPLAEGRGVQLPGGSPHGGTSTSASRTEYRCDEQRSNSPRLPTCTH